MAVRIPRLQEIKPSGAPPKNVRISARVQDSSADILSRTGAVTSLAKTGLNVKEQYEDSKIDNLTSEADREFTPWYDNKLREIKKIKGKDPTDAYANFEKEAEKKYEEILNKRPDLGGRVRRGLAKNLTKIKDSRRISMLNQSGAQVDTHKNNLYESDLKLNRSKLTDSASSVRKDETSDFDIYLNNVQTIIAKRGRENGNVNVLDPKVKNWSHSYRDNNDNQVKVSWNPLGQDRVSKELDAGINDSLNATLDAGEKDQAKLIYDKYKQFLSSKNNAAYLKKVKKIGIKDDAHKEAFRIEGLSIDRRPDAIKKIKDGEVKTEVLKIVEANERRFAAMRKRREAANHEQVSKIVNSKIKSGEWHGIADVEAESGIATMWDDMGSKNQKSIEQSFKPSKVSNSKAIIKMQNLLLGNDPDFQIETMTPEEFQVFQVDLNPSDRKSYRTDFENLRTTKKVTPAEQRTTFNRANNMLTEQLLIDGHIEKNKYGKFEGDDEIELIKAKKEMIKYLSDYMVGGPLSENELNVFIQKYTRARIDEKVFNPPKRKLAKGTKISDSRSIADYNLGRSEVFQLKKLYRDINGNIPSSTSSEFLDFVEAQKGIK